MPFFITFSRWFESNSGKGSIFHTLIVASTLPVNLPVSALLRPNLPPLKCAIVDQSQTFSSHLKALIEHLGSFAEYYEKLEDVGEADCLFLDARLGLPALGGRFNSIVITSYNHPSQNSFRVLVAGKTFARIET
mmetsp:Transcript_5946/g.8312  ORF Transcript_5946/g.8312 Transcript_5946/m.8312 type:complete len:134 (+) Transcript_5946:154-555(+)